MLTVRGLQDRKAELSISLWSGHLYQALREGVKRVCRKRGRVNCTTYGLGGVWLNLIDLLLELLCCIAS